MRKNKGFTLIELLIYIAGVGIITVVIVGIFISFGRFRGQSVTRAEVSSNLRLAMSQMAQDIRQASGVEEPSSETSVGSELVLKRANDFVTYCVSTTGALNRYISTGEPADGACITSDSPLTSDQVIIDANGGLTFTLSQIENEHLDLKLYAITIEVAMSYNSPDPNFTYTASERTTISLR